MVAIHIHHIVAQRAELLGLEDRYSESTFEHENEELGRYLVVGVLSRNRMQPSAGIRARHKAEVSLKAREADEGSPKRARDRSSICLNKTCCLRASVVATDTMFSGVTIVLYTERARFASVPSVDKSHLKAPSS
jgi:hypothetical protein